MLSIRLGLLAVLLVAGVLYLWDLGVVGFQDPDEGMYAEIAREMLASGDWIVPTFNGVPYIEKPPLMYWLTAGTFATLGLSEFSARLWKVLPILGGIVLTGILGGRLFSARTGILAAGILATSMGTYLFSRITVMDPLLLFGITLAAYGIVRAGEGSESSKNAGLYFWGGVVVGVLSKGLLGFGVPSILLTLWTVTRRDGRAARTVLAWPGILAATCLILPWHVLVAMRVPGFFQFYVLDNQVLRFLGMRGYAEDGRGMGALLFLAVTLCALFPWVPLLAAAVTSVAKGEASDGRQWFLLGWAGVMVGISLGSSFRLEYYAFPAFPAVALSVAALTYPAREVTRSGFPGEDRLAPATRQALQRWTVVALAGGILYCLGLAWIWHADLLTPLNIVRALSAWSTNYRVVLDYGLPLPPLTPGNFGALLLGGGILWVAGFAMAVWQLRAGRALAATLAVACVGLGLCLIADAVLREVGPHHSLKPLAQRLNAILRPDDTLIHEHGLEKGGGLLFYVRRPFLVLDGTRGDLAFGSSLPASADRFIDANRFEEIWRGRGRAFLVTDLPPDRTAVALITGDRPASIASTGTRWLYVNRISN